MPNLTYLDKRLTLNALLIACTLLFPACKTVEEPKDETPRPLPIFKITGQTAGMLDETPLTMDASDQKQASDNGAEPGTDNIIIERKRPQEARPPLANKPFHPSSDKGAADDEVKLNLNLQAATVEHIVMAFADKDVLDFNYLVDPAVKGAISLNMTDVTMTRKEAWELLEHLLWLSGAYMSESNNFVHVLPFEKMPKEQKLYVNHEKQPNVQALFMDIKYRKSADVINFIKPFMTDGASAIDIPDSNTIVIVETPNNVEKLQELIARLDSKGEGTWPVKCILCREVDPETLATELQTILPILGFPVAAATGPSGGAIRIAALPRMNAIVVSASMEEVLDEIAKWARTLDKEDSEDKEGIYFYNVRHSTVDILSSALDAFFTTTTTNGPTSNSSTSSSRSRTTSSSSRNSRNNTTTSNTANTTNRNTTTGTTRNTSTTTNRNNTTNRTNATGTANGKNVGSTLSVFETDVMVYTEEESNRLTIKTTPRAWNTIKAFLERQDVPPRQVAIRAVITEIMLDESLEFGISYALDRNIRSRKTNVKGGYAAAGAIANFPQLATQWTSAGLGLLFTDADNDPLAMIQAVAGTGNTKILSEPEIIARSGATAELQVGQSVPVVTEGTTYTNSSNGNFSTNYEYVETGIIMSVTPFITAGNEVRLEVNQEISGVAKTSVSEDTPTLDKKKLSTELIVPDNTTILMGGMIKNEKYEQVTGIPLLKDIPYLGAIFRSNTFQDRRAELLVLITVNVIDNKNPQEELLRKYKVSLEAIEENHQKNHLY
ncbi:MAG: hypothetical protein J6X55_14540 [Victivallales bacterium]|nr:hypothetical protein [Victivallales bacterium]